MPAPFLTIIIPTLNEAGTIREQLESLQTLHQAGVELIVADGGSRDGTPEIACPLADRVIHSSRGRALQMNAGARISAGQVLLFLHADTRLPASTLQAVQSAIASGALWGRFDVRIDSRHPVLRIVERLMNWRSRLTGIATGDQALFVQSHVFKQMGGFPEIPLMEDIALSAQLKRRSRPACLNDTVITSGRRWEKNGVWRTIVLMWRLRAQFFLGADPEKLAVRYGYARSENTAMDIAVFAKAPLPGTCKTRLIPALGAVRAARLQRRLTLQTLLLARRFAATKLVLWCAPDQQQRFFRALQRHGQIEQQPQNGNNLGQRMHHAFASHGVPLILIGTDCPALQLKHLQDAAHALQEGFDAVFIPAEDGGYVLVGLRQANSRVFEDIDWGSDRVMAQTRERLIEIGWRWCELEPLWDVDHPADVERLNQSGSMSGSKP